MLVYSMEKFTGGAISILCGSFLLDKIYDEAHLMETLNTLVSENETLRTRISEVNGILEEKGTEVIFCSLLPFRFHS